MAIESTAAEEFARQVVNNLRDAGFQALWAGGCVRDRLLQRTPKDYDVATDARPEQIRELFGHRRTLGIGAAFGVILVQGGKKYGDVEVATFRKDGGYSDGRRPDSVQFCQAEEDAKRRDFTINGLFYDPLEEHVIDYVGGQQDLDRRVVRAIGEPTARIAEDKLRMLRGVRFAATFGFQLEPETLAAIQANAPKLQAVSAERITAELERMLPHENRAEAFDLLRQSHLLPCILPEAAELNDAALNRTRDLLAALVQPTFAVALAALCFELVAAKPDQLDVDRMCQRLRLTNQDTKGTEYLLANYQQVLDADGLPWPTLQRLLITPRIEELLEFSQAVAEVLSYSDNGIQHARRRLSLPSNKLNPAPLLTGDDLRTAGYQPGPNFKQVLHQVRDAQLEERISTTDQALRLAHTLWERL